MRNKCIVWICRNQLGRRNLTDEQKTYLIGKQYEAQKMTQGGDRKSNPQSEEMIGTPHGVADVIAKEHGMGHASVARAEKFAKGIDEAEAILPGAKSNVMWCFSVWGKRRGI